MKSEYYQLITIAVTIISLFISNYLGQRAHRLQHQYGNKEIAYKKFYLPIIQQLHETNKEHRNYFTLIVLYRYAPGKSGDWFSNHITNNLEFAPTKVAELISEYNICTNGAEMFYSPDGYRENYRKNAIRASELFDSMLIIILEEAKILSKTLGYPDIATPLLNDFQNIEATPMNHPKYLPEIYQECFPNIFEGDKPPYY